MILRWHVIISGVDMNSEHYDAIKREVGDPATVIASLATFKKSAKVFSSRRQRLISKYDKRWVAAVDGKVVADAGTQNELYRKLDAMGVPPGTAMVLFSNYGS